MRTIALILAAGYGKRMHSAKSKVLHEIGGVPMLVHVYNAVAPQVNVKPVVVVGSNQGEIKQILGDQARYVVQEPPLGTGHAALVVVDLLKDVSDQIILMYGDMPLIREQTVARLVHYRMETGAIIAMVSMFGSPESTFGRVIRDPQGVVTEVVEWADAKQRENASELIANRELNAGLYCFETAWFCDNVGKIIPRPSREGDEYYLTDIFRIARDQDRLVVAMPADDNDEFFGISTTADLNMAEAIFQRRLLGHLDAAPGDEKRIEEG